MILRKPSETNRDIKDIKDIKVESKQIIPQVNLDVEIQTKSYK